VFQDTSVLIEVFIVVFLRRKQLFGFVDGGKCA
jgi:hypothetical protein